MNWIDHEPRGFIKTLTELFFSYVAQLQENVLVLAEEELDNYTVSAWKEIKFQQNSNGPVGMHRRPVIHV